MLSMAENTETVHHRSCNLCEAICGLEIRVAHGQITSIRGDKEDPFSRGHICPKAVALQDIHNDPDRLRHPMRRTASGWERLGWDEAVELAAKGLRTVQEAHGLDAVAMYIGNPAVHNYGNLIYGPPLLRALKSKNRFSATSVDQLPHQLVAWFMFGHQLLLPIPDLERTRFLLILGGNPAVSNGSLMTCPDVKKRLQEIRQRGGRVVLLDPRRTETARLVDEHHFIRPGTDALFLMALVHTLFEEGLTTLGSLAEHLKGLEDVRRLAADFAPEKVSAITGLAATDIRRLAREMATAEGAACYGRMGVSTQEFGGICQWLINVLNILTGNFDRPGGVLFTRPAVDLVARPYGGGSHGRFKSRVRGLPESGGELPVSVLAEEILTEGEGQVRALITAAGNPALSTPNGRQLERALGSLEFMVSIDLYINETTRHADLILPPTATLEHDHYDIVFNLLAVRNTARYSPPLFEPAADTRHDWQILHQLRRRLDRDQRLSTRFERWLMGKIGPKGALDMMLRKGPHGAGWNPFRSGLTLRRLERSIHGLDLGPLEPCMPGRLKTRDGKLNLAPEVLVGDVERLRQRLETETPSLVMIGRRQVRSNNSWMHNYPRLMRGKDRCTLLMHPQDAERCGVADGERVVVRSRVGEVEAPLELSDEVMPGVVSLPHGWGHRSKGVQITTAQAHPGINLNDLTDDTRVDEASGNAVLNGLPVSVGPVLASVS